MNLNHPTASHRISQGFTRLDCAKRQVTGIRYDPIINQYEIWVFGTLKREVPAEGGRESLNYAYEEVFGLPKGSIQL